MSHQKDTDYLALSARLHAMENRLLTRERMERMIEAKTPADAARVLTECGYRELPQVTAATVEELLGDAWSHVFDDLTAAAPDPSLLDVFRVKPDYHNAKVLVKAAVTGADPAPLLTGGGRYDPKALLDGFRRDDLRFTGETYRTAVSRAVESLAATGDPQTCDFILDRACYGEMSAAAARTGIPFVKEYVAMLIDVVNLRTVVRASRLGRGESFLNQVLLPGGTVEASTLARTRAEDLPQLFPYGPLTEAAQLGAAVAAPGSGSLTAFERACDNGMTAFAARARRVPFGPETVIGHLYARELELGAIRIILTGRLAGLDGDTIRERLRDCYA